MSCFINILENVEKFEKSIFITSDRANILRLFPILFCLVHCFCVLYVFVLFVLNFYACVEFCILLSWSSWAVTTKN